MAEIAATPSSPATPVLFLHCRQVYDAMMQQAFKTGGGETTDGPEPEMVVYEGRLVQLITRDLHLSVPYYSHVRTALMRMGCIRQLRRGGGGSPSQWELIHELTEELFLNSEPPRKPSTDKTSML